MKDDITVVVAAPATFSDELPPGARVGDYLVEGKIAAGGCGTVYSAHHRTKGGRAAVKVLHRYLASSAEMVERFVREAHTIQRVAHPNVVKVHEVGELKDRRPFLVMELLSGKSLSIVLQRRGRFPPREALTYADRIAAALEAAHAAGIVHRDVKGSNVMVLREGDDPELKLLDFGIAKLTQVDPQQPALTAVGQRIGTPSAMAPEQIRGVAVDARADVYALGVLIFQMLTGRTPFVAADATEMERLHLEAPPPRPSSLAPVSAPIDAVVLRCLEKDPARRYPTVAAVREALRAAGGGESAAERSVEGAAFYVEVPIATDDDLLLAADAIERVAAELTKAGFRMHVQTGTALVAVRAIPADAALAAVERRDLCTLGEELARTEPRPSVQLHTGPLQVREAPDGASFSGPLLQIETWVSAGPPGFRATAAAQTAPPRRTGAP